MPVAWGIPIASFVWWVGIGQAGTFISAFLYVMRQQWRGSINRFGEAMTIFAVLCAGMYPVLHLGRPWVAYWLAPYPNRMGMWPQFRSPLVWDFLAVTIYLIVSALFWYVALVPDFATIRDRSQNPLAKRIYGVLSFGWCGDAFHWARFLQAYGLFACLATALVICVHSIVGLDFAVAQVPGWHETVTPPYFVAGAIFSGVALLAVLVIPIRAWYGLKEIILLDHLEWMAKIILLTGSIVGYSYIVEVFTAFYHHSRPELLLMQARLSGPYRYLYWPILLINGVMPQLFWAKKVRRNLPALFLMSILIVVGMWLERYEITTVALRRDYLPSTWNGYSMTFWDWAVLLGTVGFFITMMLIFVRFVPCIAIFEVRSEAKPDPGPATFRDFERGVVGSYPDEDSLRSAVQRVREAGLSARAFTPHPVKGLAETLGFKENRLPWLIFAGGASGAAIGWGIQVYVNVVDYPLNIGGRALNSIAAFVPATYEISILGAVLAGAIGLFWLNGFPHLSDPVFELPGMERTTQDRFMLMIADHPDMDRSALHEIVLGGEVNPPPAVAA
jgi:Ni/Fe-hydrogenase subunit HybB-like protein